MDGLSWVFANLIFNHMILIFTAHRITTDTDNHFEARDNCQLN